MRLLLNLVISFIVLLSPITALANELFYGVNSDLKRVGLEEIKEMSRLAFESGNYRLDPDFRIGFGDTLTINLWGKLEASHKLTIDRDGNIVVPLLGRISLIGMTLNEALSTVKKEVDRKYSNVEVDLNLADVQSIWIILLGNIKKPGPYSVSPFSRISEAVAIAGGPNDNGSLFDIKLIRNDKEVASFNIYDFIFKADQSKNLRLQQGDIIYVSRVKNLVAIKGELAYPGIYEIGDDVKLSKFIDTIGGMLSTKFKRKISVLRVNPNTKLTENLTDVIFEQSKGIEPNQDVILEHYDTVIVTTTLDYTPFPEDLYKVVHATGEFKISGNYLVKQNETLNSLIKRAEGLKNTAFIKGAIFTRPSLQEKQKSILDELIRAQEIAILKEEAALLEVILTTEEKEIRQKALERRRKALNLMASRLPSGRIVINLEEIINGTSDILLERRDAIYVPPIPDWVLVTGAVYNPESVSFDKGKSLQYYLNTVGGPTKFADKDYIYIIKADGRVESKETSYGEIDRGDIIVVPEERE